MVLSFSRLWELSPTLHALILCEMVSLVSRLSAEIAGFDSSNVDGI